MFLGTMSVRQEMGVLAALKRWRAETRREEELSSIRGARATFETMVKRAEIAGELPDGFVSDIRTRLETVQLRADQVSADELHDLVQDADSLAQLRAYFCPPNEIRAEGSLTIDLMEEWGVPSFVTAKLRETLGHKLADDNVVVARGALRAVLEEFDSWSEYVNDYDETMQRTAYILLAAVTALCLIAMILLHFPKTVIFGLFAAGAAGGCVSVISKLPPLGLSGEFSAYQRRILSRIGTGVAASVIGSALLGWGLIPISIQSRTFADVLRECSASGCTGATALILIGIPMLFGFSERALASFEKGVFGEPRAATGRRTPRNPA